VGVRVTCHPANLLPPITKMVRFKSLPLVEFFFVRLKSQAVWILKYVLLIFWDIESRNYSFCPQKNVILVFRGVKQFKFWLKLYKKVQTFMIQKNIITLIIEYIFIINLFRDINVNNIYYKLGQTWVNLTGTHPIIASFRGLREN